MSLQERANQFMKSVKPFCPIQNKNDYFEIFIVTVKQNEVVAWSFECLICTRTDCPFCPMKK